MKITGGFERLSRFAAGEAIICGIHVLYVDAGENSEPLIIKYLTRSGYCCTGMGMARIWAGFLARQPEGDSYAGEYAADDAAVMTLLDDIEATFNVARGPRMARQARLGANPRA